MNKVLITGAFSVFLLLVLASGILAISSTPKVAYIYKSKVMIDQNVVSVFNELGLTTEYIKETEIPSDLSQYRFIYVGDEFFSRNIPINKYPTLLSNYNLVEKTGLVASNGIGKLASRDVLSVNIDNKLVTVYTKARDNNGVSIPYYYIDNVNKAKSVKKVAGTYTTSSGPDFGYVISTVSKGEKLLNNKVAGGDICFFGIIKSEYWTDDARKMFKDCVGYVNKPLASEIMCTQNSDCGTNVFVGETSCTNNNVMQSYVSYSCSNPGQVSSSCSNTTTIKLVKSCILCSKGACLKVDCTKDSDCNDNNTYTQDTCISPGTTGAKCVNTKIPNCAKDTDCNDKNSSTEDICKNPGTIDAICIHNLPGKIMILSFIATPSDISVKLDISANLTDSNSVVKKFKLKKNNDSWIESTENSYTFSGLTQNTEYTFFALVVDNNNKSSDPASITIRTLATPEPPPVVPSSGGGGGGGGGGSYLGGMSWCSIKWECSPWSECVKGIQFRKCSIPTGKCTPEGEKPAENQSCTVVPKPVETAIPVETKKEFSQPVPVATPESSAPATNPITGAAIAANIGKYSWLWIPVMLIGIIAAYYFLAGGRMRKVTPKA